MAHSTLRPTSTRRRVPLPLRVAPRARCGGFPRSEPFDVRVHQGRRGHPLHELDADAPLSASILASVASSTAYSASSIAQYVYRIANAGVLLCGVGPPLRSVLVVLGLLRGDVPPDRLDLLVPALLHVVEPCRDLAAVLLGGLAKVLAPDLEVFVCKLDLVLEVGACFVARPCRLPGLRPSWRERTARPTDLTMP